MTMSYVKKQNDPGESGCLKCELINICERLPENYCTAVGNDFEDYYQLKD